MARRSVSIQTALKNSVPRGSRLLIAVSGGKDSIVLLHALHRLKRMLKLTIEVAHVDHSLREDSVEDANFVKKIAKSLSITCHTKNLQPPNAGLNIEDWGRKERYSFFRKILEERDLEYIVTAHHSNDLAETFLMRLVSNKELRGILAKSKKYKVLRPLLSVTRKEIERYLEKYSLEYREDSTNFLNKFLRNQVRNILIPKLKESFHPKVEQWIAERARALERDSRCLDRMALKKIKSLPELKVNSAEFIGLVRDEPEAISLRLIELALLPILKFRLGYSRAKVVRRVLLKRASSCDLPNGFRLKWTKGQLIMQGQEEQI